VLCVLQIDERNVSTCELVNKERDARSICEMMMVVEDVNGRGNCRFIFPSLVQYSGSITVLVGVEFKMEAEKMKSSAGVQFLVGDVESEDGDIVLRHNKTREKRGFPTHIE
jgi:hypothetical protein